MWHSEFCDDERASEVHVDRVVPLLKFDLQNIAHSLAIAGIYDENVRMLAVLFFDFVEEALQVAFFADITLVK